MKKLSVVSGQSSVVGNRQYPLAEMRMLICRHNTEMKWAALMLLAFGIVAVGVPSKLNADDAQKQLEKAEKLYKDGKWDNAAKECRKVLKKSPESVDAHELLGLALEHAGDHDGALAEYREIIRLQPQNDGSHYRAAEILAAKGDADGAITEYREAIRLNSDKALYHYELSFVLEQKGDFRAALDECKIVERLDASTRSFATDCERLAALAEGNTEPVPTYKPAPPYSENARREKVQGTVAVEFVVDEAGKVSDVSVKKSLDPELDRKVVETVRTWRFKPATRKGKPVAVKIIADITFRL